MVLKDISVFHVFAENTDLHKPLSDISEGLGLDVERKALLNILLIFAYHIGLL
jgi:hypothetical protein